MIRNKNVDIIRSLSLLLVLIYHCWIKIGAVPVSSSVVSIIVRLGGEIGVTAFFVLSGYGIYQSIYYTEKTGKIKFVRFMKKRLKRILPQYYLNLLMVLCMTTAAVYIEKQHIWNVISHILLIHNNFLNYAGAINGVLWTLGVTFQFYIIAIPVFKLFNKIGFLCVPVSIFVTVLCKMIAFRSISYHWDVCNYAIYSFWLGRQIILTDLDNFVIGMGVAFLANHSNGISKRISAVGCFVSVIILYLLCELGSKYGIHTDNISGYLWHSEVAICIGSVMLFAQYIGGKNRTIVSKVLLWISKYEYGIYLWHLIIIDNLIQNAPVIHELLSTGNYFIVGTMFVAVSICIGVIFTKLTNLEINR